MSQPRSVIKLSIKLEAATRQDGGQWLAWCPPIDVITQASTKKKALSALREAVELWFESCLDWGVTCGRSSFTPTSFRERASARIRTDAKELIRQMDAAGAYQFGNPFRPTVANEYERVKDENDGLRRRPRFARIALWHFAASIRSKAMRFRRLTAALRDLRLRRGLKLHFGNSDVEMDKPGHVEPRAEVR